MKSPAKTSDAALRSRNRRRIRTEGVDRSKEPSPQLQLPFGADQVDEPARASDTSGAEPTQPVQASEIAAAITDPK